MKTSLRFGGYLLYAILLIFSLRLLFHYDAVLRELSKTTFDHFPYVWYSTLYPVLIGALLALPTFIRTFRSYGRWRFDWVPFVTVGIPALFGTFSFFIYFSPLGQYLPIFSFFVTTNYLPMICGIAFGYFILYSFQKNS